jgi:hypothetical protein
VKWPRLRSIAAHDQDHRSSEEVTIDSAAEPFLQGRSESTCFSGSPRCSFLETSRSPDFPRGDQAQELAMKPIVRTNAMEYQQSQQQREVVKRLLKGDLPYQVISHPGTSQYAQGEGRGVSACGLAALNCARCLLEKASRASAAPDAFLHDLFARETIDVSGSSTATISRLILRKTPIIAGSHLDL